MHYTQWVFDNVFSLTRFTQMAPQYFFYNLPQSESKDILQNILNRGASQYREEKPPSSQEEPQEDKNYDRCVIQWLCLSHCYNSNHCCTILYRNTGSLYNFICLVSTMSFFYQFCHIVCIYLWWVRQSALIYEELLLKCVIPLFLLFCCSTSILLVLFTPVTFSNCSTDNHPQHWRSSWLMRCSDSLVLAAAPSGMDTVQ